jgi:tetratricopeptide (TPR) repeat protein
VARADNYYRDLTGKRLSNALNRAISPRSGDFPVYPAESDNNQRETMMRLQRFNVVLALILLSFSVRADEANDRFFEGIDQLANGKFDAAADLFDKAIAGNPQVAAYHLDRGIAMMALDRGDQATQSLARAVQLDPKNADVRVWAHARLLMFDPTTQGGSPPYGITPYATKLINAAMAYGTPHRPEERVSAKAAIVQIAKDFGWRQAGQAGADVSLKRIVAMYQAQEYRQCLAFIDRLRAQGPLTPAILGYSAHCRVGLKDYQGARGEYTLALKAFPVTAGWLIGRAKCEIAMGSLRDADADFALSALIDPKLTAKFTADSQKELDEARSKIPKESPAELLALLKQSVAANKPNDEEPLKLAEKLMRLRYAARNEDPEEYTREYARLQIAVNGDPQNVDKLVAFAKFLIVPTVTRKVAIAGTDATAAIPCGTADNARAKVMLGAAAKIAPENPGVVLQEVLYFHAVNDFKDMIACVNHAVEAGQANLDICVLHLEYYTELADQQTNEAIRLRTPTYTSSQHREGNKIVTTTVEHDPTPADLARADQLDALSTQLRIRAHKPLEAFIARLQNAADPASKAQYQLALAHDFRWRGKYEQAIQAAQGALASAPYDLDTLNFLIDLTPQMGHKDLGNGYQDFLNNIINPSAGRTLDKVWPLLRQNQGAAALEVVERAEKMEPSSVQAQGCRFAIAEQLGNLSDMNTAARLVVLMEEARLRLGGRTLLAKATTPLSAADAGLSVYVRVHLAQALEHAGKVNEAITMYRGAGATVSRVPAAEWPFALANTRLTTDERDRGTTLAALAQIAWRRCAYAALSQKQYDQAANDCAELARSGDIGQDAYNIGLQIFRAVGWKSLAGRVPDNWQMMFQQNGGAPNNGQPFDAEIAAIDARLEKIEREILHGLGPAELAQFTAERDKLIAQRQALLKQRRQR